MAAGVDTYVDGGLDPDLAHDYRVGAYNSAGTSYSFANGNGVTISDDYTWGVDMIQDATELGPDGHPIDGFIAFSRSDDPIDSITLNYTVNTTAADSATPGREYQGLPGTVTLGAGIYTVLVPVTPNEIHAVEPTSTVRVDLAPGDGYFVLDANPGAATLRINNTDTWTATLGDGTNYNLLTASPDGTQNLQQVTLSFPHPAGESFTVKVTSSDTTEDDLWDPALPGATGTPGTLVLGTDASGNVLDSYTFTTDPNAQSKTFLVGATQGDSRMFVLQYYFNGIENTDTSTPTFLGEQESGQLGPNELAKPATTRSNDSENLGVSIKVNSPPNHDPTANGVDKPHNWLVGQMANLTATVTGPTAVVHKITYNWDIPGNHLGTFDDKVTSATTTDAEEYGYVTGTGNLTVPLSFFWVSTTYDPSHGGVGPDVDTVKLSVESWDRTKTGNGSLNFNLYTATPSDTTIVKGVVRFVTRTDLRPLQPGFFKRYVGLYSDPNVANPLPDPMGIVFGAGVSTPQPNGNGATFSAGTFKFIQLIKPSNQFTATGVPVPFRSKIFNQWGIDSNTNGPADPETGFKLQLDAQGHFQIDPFDGVGNSGYLTDKAVHDVIDHPSTRIAASDPAATAITDPYPGLSKIDISEDFLTYIMYRPPGVNSQWVPLVVEKWSLNYVVSHTAPAPKQITPGIFPTDPWTIISTNVNIPKDPERSISEPLWNQVVKPTDL